MYKKIVKSKNVTDLRKSLEEAEIIRTCARIALMNPALDPELRGEYEIACMRLNAEIRDLKMRMDDVQRKTHTTESRLL
ncbi:MAG: hypothetical protein ABSG75_10740 [Syntrophales bacterium]|jgi:hypothetical protein